MKTKERLERSGWVFQSSSGNVDYYKRNVFIILYDNENNEAIGFYVPEGVQKTPIYHPMDERQLDLFCKY